MSRAGRWGRHPFRYDSAWLIPLGVDELWTVLSDTRAYPGWWPWLRRAELPELAVGGLARFSVAPPLPYRIDVRLLLDQVEPARRIHTTVGGDLDGWATLELTPDGTGRTHVRLQSTLAFSRPGLRALTLAGRPILAWGHERVVRRGLEGFAEANGLAVAPGGIEPADSDRTSRSEPLDRGPDRILRDGIVAGAIAGLASGLPSTLWALGTRSSPLTASRAAGTLLGRAGLIRGALAHSSISLAWGVVLSATLPRTHRVTSGAVAGAAIAALDLRVVARRRFPAVAALPVGPQVADHLLYGALVGLVLERRCTDTA